MVLQPIGPGRPWLAQLAKAAAISLAALLGLTVLVGAYFVPEELRRLQLPKRVSITHYVPPRGDRPGVALYWSIPARGSPGWEHALRVHTTGDQEQFQQDISGISEPSSLAAVESSQTLLVGESSGVVHAVEFGKAGAPHLLGKQHGGGVVAIAGSSDGRFVISQDAFCLYGWDRTDRKQLWFRDDLPCSCFVPRPMEPTAIVGCLDGRLVEIDLVTGQTINESLATLDFPQALAISSNGSQLAILGADGQLQLADSESLSVIWSRRIEWSSGTSRFLTLSPCGKWLISPSPNDARQLSIWEAASGRAARQIAGHDAAVLGAAFDEQSSLYSFGADGTVRRWDLTDDVPAHVARLLQLTSDA